ncbi:MAG: VOC family protein [Pseudomonadota bacterium]
MIGYTIVGTKDLSKAKAFYDPLFENMGLRLCFADDGFVSWGDPDDDTVPRFFVCYPIDDRPALPGNGTMTAFRIARASQVDDLYTMALDLGGSDEGGPGTRPEYGDRFYVAYVRDLDGNKLAFACYDAIANP